MKKVSERGAILLISLWILLLLTLLAFGLTYRISLEMRLADYDRERSELFYLLHGALHQASATLGLDDPEVDSLQDPWAMPSTSLADDPDSPISLGEGSFQFTIEDEFSRINLNTATAEALSRIEGMESEVLRCLRFWRGDQDLDPSFVEGERAYYRSLPRPIEREPAPLQTLEELLLVRGMTPSLYETLQSLGTVYGAGKANLNTASKAALVVLGLEESIAERLLLYRLGEDGEPATEDDRPFMGLEELSDADLFEAMDLASDEQMKFNSFLSSHESVLTLRSDHFRIRAKALSPGLPGMTARAGKTGMTKELTAVLQRIAGGAAVIKYWHEE